MRDCKTAKLQSDDAYVAFLIQLLCHASNLANSGNYPARWPTFLVKQIKLYSSERYLSSFLLKIQKSKKILTKSGCMSVRNVNILPWFPNSRSRVTTCLLRRMYSRIIFLGNATHKVRTKTQIFHWLWKCIERPFLWFFFLIIAWKKIVKLFFF